MTDRTKLAILIATTGLLAAVVLTKTVLSVMTLWGSL